MATGRVFSAPSTGEELASGVEAPVAAAIAAASATARAASASFSARGESGIVSRLDMLGLRERAEVGVEGTEEDERAVVYVEERGSGYVSLNWFE